MSLYYILVLCAGCLVATSYLIPKIISVVRYKHLMENPNERSSHGTATPSLGGIAFFIVFVISLSFNNYFDEYQVSMSILPGLTVLFFLGLKDDLVVLSARMKLLGQCVACLFILQNPHFQLNNLGGFLGIFEIPLWISIPMGLFLMLAIINSFNLIDGIDGLAASIATIIFIFFAWVFNAIHLNFMFLTAISMIGILIGFLYFNLSPTKKIFMGDTGSMQIGFIIAIMTMRFLAANETNLGHLPFQSSFKPLIVFVLLIVPVYDAVRVFIMRILKGKHPFTPSRDHFHHLLIDGFNLSHWKGSFIIVLFNVFFLGISLFVMHRFSVVELILLILCFLVLMTIFCVKLERMVLLKSKNHKEPVKLDKSVKAPLLGLTGKGEL